jgi:hypothetical protein
VELARSLESWAASESRLASFPSLIPVSLDRHGLGIRIHREIAGRRDGFVPPSRALHVSPHRIRPAVHGRARRGVRALHGDIVLCKIRGSEYLHFVKAIQGDRFQIGNNRGLINGWIGANGIFGRLSKTEP